MNKELARKQKEADKIEAHGDNSKHVACFDLQKVLTVPAGDISVLYYKSKLATYNFTVYDMANKKGSCFMWYETIGARGANEISTCVFKYISSLPEEVKTITFFSDNCGGQNRNHIISAMYLKAMTENSHLEEHYT